MRIGVTLRTGIGALIVGLSSLDLGFGFHSGIQKLSFFRAPTAAPDVSHFLSLSTVVDSPTKERVDRKAGNGRGALGDKEENFIGELRKKGPLEWLEDEAEPRDMEDPFHILLLQQTFEKARITVPYVASSLEYVLDMPIDEATELSKFSHDHGMSCLGVWPREECLKLGKQLQVRDIVCRVVPRGKRGKRLVPAVFRTLKHRSSLEGFVFCIDDRRTREFFHELCRDEQLVTYQ
jgi:hypothetical protein